MSWEILFCSVGEEISFFSLFFSLSPPFFPFFADFWSTGQGDPSFPGWSYIPPGLIFLLPLAELPPSLPPPPSPFNISSSKSPFVSISIEAYAFSGLRMFFYAFLHIECLKKKILFLFAILHFPFTFPIFMVVPLIECFDFKRTCPTVFTLLPLHIFLYAPHLLQQLVFARFVSISLHSSHNFCRLD